MTKTSISHRGNRFNVIAMKAMLDNDYIDFESDDFPIINKGDWTAITTADNNIEYGIVVDVFEYSPYEIDISMCYQDIYYVRTLDNIVHDCFYNDICSHVSTRKIKSIAKELKKKITKIE